MCYEKGLEASRLFILPVLSTQYPWSQVCVAVIKRVWGLSRSVVFVRFLNIKAYISNTEIQEKLHVHPAPHQPPARRRGLIESPGIKLGGQKFPVTETKTYFWSCKIHRWRVSFWVSLKSAPWVQGDQRTLSGLYLGPPIWAVVQSHKSFVIYNLRGNAMCHSKSWVLEIVITIQVPTREICSYL